MKKIWIMIFLFSVQVKAGVECMHPDEVLEIEKQIGNSIGGMHIDRTNFFTTSSRPRLIHFPSKGTIWSNHLELLRSTFQVYKIAERPEDVTPNAYPVGHRDNPYNSALIPLCSGAFNSAQEFTTASHCLRSKNVPVEGIHILRRYNFVLKGSTVKRQGYTDYRIAADSIERQGDLARARVVGQVPGPYLNHADEARLGSDELLAIGYPSDSHGVPVISIDCGRPTFVAHHDLSSTCPVLGGMSGGPVLSEAGGQIGIVSESSVDNQLTFPSFFSVD